MIRVPGFTDTLDPILFNWITPMIYYGRYKINRTTAVKTDSKPDVRVFRWPDSVLGARCSALGVNPVPGIRYQVPGSWYPGPGTRYLAECLAHASKTRTPG